MTLRNHVIRALVSAVIVGMPLLCIPPWIHVEPLDPFFDTTRYGDLDRHAPIWNPPFSEAVAQQRVPRSPVVIDRARLRREWLVAAILLYGVFTLVAVAAERAFHQDVMRRMTHLSRRERVKLKLKLLLISREACVVYAACLAMPAGFGLLFPLGRLFDLLHLPVFNTWALFHASAFIAWPMLSLLVGLGLWPLLRLAQQRAQARVRGAQ